MPTYVSLLSEYGISKRLIAAPSDKANELKAEFNGLAEGVERRNLTVVISDSYGILQIKRMEQE